MSNKSIMTYLEMRALILEIVEGLEMYTGLYNRRASILELRSKKEIEDVGKIIDRHLAKVEMKLISTIKVLDDLRNELVKYWDKPEVLMKCVWEPEEVTRRKNLNRKVKRLINDLRYADI